MTNPSRRKRVAVLAAFIAASMAAGAAIASTATQANQGSKKLSVLRGNPDFDSKNLTATPTTQYLDVPGISTTISIPSGQTGLILARFSATSVCNFGAAGKRCETRLVVVKPGGAEETLGGGALDTDDTGDNFAEAHMFEGSGGPYGPGAYTVKLQYRIIAGGNTRLQLGGGWHLAVEYWRAT